MIRKKRGWSEEPRCKGSWQGQIQEQNEGRIIGQNSNELNSNSRIPTNILALNLGFILQQTEVAVQILPGNLLRDVQICRDLSTAYSAFSKAEKVRAPSILTATMDMDSLDLAVLSAFVDPDSKYVMKDFTGIERFQPTPVLRSHIIEARKAVRIANISEHRLKFVGVLHAENTYAFSFHHLCRSAVEADPNIPPTIVELQRQGQLACILAHYDGRLFDAA